MGWKSHEKITVGYPVAAGVNNEPPTALRRPPELPKWRPGDPQGCQNGAPGLPKWSPWDFQRLQNRAKTGPKQNRNPLVWQGLPKNTRSTFTIGPPTAQRTNFVSIFINKPKHMYWHTYTVQSANQPSHKPTRQQTSQKEFYIACVFYRDTYASIILCLQQMRPLCFDLGPATRTTTVPVAIQDILSAQRHQHWASGAERRTWNWPCDPCVHLQ